LEQIHAEEYIYVFLHQRKIVLRFFTYGKCQFWSKNRAMIF